MTNTQQVFLWPAIYNTANSVTTATWSSYAVAFEVLWRYTERAEIIPGDQVLLEYLQSYCTVASCCGSHWVAALHEPHVAGNQKIAV